VTPRVVLDSNVIVSGLAWSGPPARIVDAALDGQLELLTSHSLLGELRRVLAYPKLAKAIGEGGRLADLVESCSVIVEPRIVITAVTDESDNRILEAATEGAADYIVSGDAHLLVLGSFRGIPIVEPSQFVRGVLER
jgi:putative PIN family toxin of toxin-antitoxin system